MIVLELYNKFITFFNEYIYYNLFKEQQSSKLILIGLDGVGKTSILYKLKMRETISTISTIGFNVETIIHKNFKMTIWDLSGQDKYRQDNYWNKFYEGTNAIIFVIDSTDDYNNSSSIGRLELIKKEIDLICNHQDELKGLPLLIFSNKQDLPNSISNTQIINLLNLNSIIKNRNWTIQECSAMTSLNSIEKGFDWIANNLNNKLKTN